MADATNCRAVKIGRLMSGVHIPARARAFVYPVHGMQAEKRRNETISIEFVDKFRYS